MGQGTGSVNCKHGDEPLKIVETKGGMLAGNCRDNQYQMDDDDDEGTTSGAQG
jgi:hypothetical protein